MRVDADEAQPLGRVEVAQARVRRARREAAPRTAPLSARERGALWWVAPPLAVLIAANLLFEVAGGAYAQVADEAAMLTAKPGDVARNAVAASAAISWAGLALVHLSIGTGASIGAWSTVSERVRGRARRPFVLLFIGGGCLGLLHLAAVEAMQAPLNAIFAVTRDALSALPAVGATRAAVIGGVVGAINVLTPFVMALLIAAAAASALPPVAGWSETTLARRAAQIRRIVLLAGAFMVGGVLHMGAWTHLAGATLSTEGDAVLDEVALTVTLFWGTTFTLMIASFYVPVAMRLIRLAERVMEDIGVPVAERQHWLADRGLSFRLREQLPQIVAMVSPLLAGPIGSTVQSYAETVGR